jgi:hypothetical protein
VRRALKLVEPTDLVPDHASALLMLAEVRDARDQGDAAAAARSEAIAPPPQARAEPLLGRRPCFIENTPAAARAGARDQLGHMNLQAVARLGW